FWSSSDGGGASSASGAGVSGAYDVTSGSCTPGVGVGQGSAPLCSGALCSGALCSGPLCSGALCSSVSARTCSGWSTSCGAPTSGWAACSDCCQGPGAAQGGGSPGGA